MGLTTYEFYTGTYYGDSVAESSFTKWNERATDMFKYLCGDGLTQSDITTYSTQVQKSVCALIDVMYKLDQATQGPGTSVKSMSSGGQSITYGDSVITKALESESEKMKLFMDTIRTYLYSTDILYQGI